MVTCILLDEADKRHMDTRYWGFSFDQETAVSWAQYNTTDMFETGYYNYAVVEKVYEGLIAIAEEIAWFEWKFTSYYEPGVITRLTGRPDIAGPKNENFNWFESGPVYKMLVKVNDIAPEKWW